MYADHTSNPIARYGTLVRAYEALSEKMAEHERSRLKGFNANLLRRAGMPTYKHIGPVGRNSAPQDGYR